MIATAGPSAAFAVKAATATIPSLFMVAEDPVRLDLVASLARPSGNLTGINVFNSELVTKRLELLRELVPRAKQVAVLVDRTDEANAGSTLRDAEAAARAMGLRIQVFNANTKREIDVAFEAMAREKADALFVGAFPFLNGRRVQLVQLAAFHRLPATYSQREIAEVGGLMSYGANLGDAYRQLGERAQFRAFQSEPPKVLFEESQSILVPENTQSFFGIFATYSHSPTR